MGLKSTCSSGSWLHCSSVHFLPQFQKLQNQKVQEDRPGPVHTLTIWSSYVLMMLPPTAAGPLFSTPTKTTDLSSVFGFQSFCKTNRFNEDSKTRFRCAKTFLKSSFQEYHGSEPDCRIALRYTGDSRLLLWRPRTEVFHMTSDHLHWNTHSRTNNDVF